MDLLTAKKKIFIKPPTLGFISLKLLDASDLIFGGHVRVASQEKGQEDGEATGHYGILAEAILDVVMLEDQTVIVRPVLSGRGWRALWCSTRQWVGEPVKQGTSRWNSCMAVA